MTRLSPAWVRRFAVITGIFAGSLGAAAIHAGPADKAIFVVKQSLYESLDVVGHDLFDGVRNKDLEVIDRGLDYAEDSFVDALDVLYEMARLSRTKPCDPELYDAVVDFLDELLAGMEDREGPIYDRTVGWLPGGIIGLFPFEAYDLAPRFWEDLWKKLEDREGRIFDAITRTRIFVGAIPEDCGKLTDALPTPEPTAPVLSGKSKDQIAFANVNTGENIPGNTVTVTRVPTENPQGTDTDTQANATTVEPDQTYVVAAPCKVEQVMLGADLVAADVVTLDPKPIRLRISYCSTWNDAAKTSARNQLTHQGSDPNLDHYDVASVQHGVTRYGPGNSLQVDHCDVVLVPKTPSAAAGGLGCSMGIRTDTAPQTTTAPPMGDDDPSTDDLQVTPPATGTTEGQVGSGPERPEAESGHLVTWGSGGLASGDVRSGGAERGEVAQRRTASPNDRYFTSRGSWGQAYADQWGLHRIGFTADGGDPARSPWPERGQPVIVAVIDTGVDRFHPELRGAMWINRKEIPGNRRDDDGNGYVDDVYGWNFANNDNDTMDLAGHGTVVAGVIAAWTNNGIGIAGVNPWARIMPVKVSTWSGNTSNFEIADAIRYAADNGARVINISYGGRHRRWTEYQAIAYARQKGVIVVAAAGNQAYEAQSHSPGGLPSVITVAATGVDDKRLGFSNWGPGVDISAPGWDILSLRARGTDMLRFLRDDYQPGSVFVGDDKRYYRLTGTSFAAPFVAGAASLIWSIQPNLTDVQVMRMLLHSARDIETPGWDQYTGYGLLDVSAALAADPRRYIQSRILGVSGKQVGKDVLLEVSGRAQSDRFRRAWIEAGRGEMPREWVRVAEVGKPVDRGPLALISPQRLQGSADWTLRLMVEREDGTRRESRFKLTLQ